MNEPIKLSPFTKFCVTLGMIPTSYKISLTYEEQLLWLCNYLENTIIPAVNNNAEALEEVQKLFAQLTEFVNNYFENLDVQEEINNKLDEMADDGTLASIINKGYIYASAYPTTTKAEIETMFSQIALLNRTLFIDKDIDLLGENYSIENLYLKGDNVHKITNGGKITTNNVIIEDCIINNMLDEISINGYIANVNNSKFDNWKFSVLNASSNIEKFMYFNINNNEFTNIGALDDINSSATLISCIAIPYGSGQITNNKFIDIGQTTNLSSTKVLYLGKTPTYTREEISQSPATRTKSMEVVNTIVSNNIFKNINNADGINLETGSMDEVAQTNAIAIRCDNTIISKNIIENINGFGQDREAIYTKSNNTQIINNTIINGGTGEGAICCKPYAKPDYDNEENETGLIYFDSSNIIAGNTIKGYCPVAIKTWSYANIENNNINIDGSSYIQARMSTGNHYEEHSDHKLNILNNNIRVEKITTYTKSYTLNNGTVVTYTDNDTANYNNMPFRYENFKDADILNLKNNEILIVDLNTLFDYRAGENPNNQEINITNNEMTLISDTAKTNAIYFYGSNTSYNNTNKCQDLKVNIINNNIKVKALNLIRFDYYNNADKSQINIINNNTESLNDLLWCQQMTATNNTASTQDTLINIANNNIKLISEGSTLNGKIATHMGSETINIVNNNFYGDNATTLYSIQSNNTKKVTIKGNSLTNQKNVGFICASSGSHSISWAFIEGNFVNNIEVPFNSNLTMSICYFINNAIINTTADEQSEIGGTISTLVFQNNFLGLRTYSI